MHVVGFNPERFGASAFDGLSEAAGELELVHKGAGDHHDGEERQEIDREIHAQGVAFDFGLGGFVHPVHGFPGEFEDSQDP